MKKAFFFVLLSILLMCLACQPTPTEEVVNNRIDGSMRSVILSQAEDPYQYEAPNAWQEELSIRDQTIFIHASIEAPESTMHPVYTVKNRPITIGTCISLLQQLFGTDLQIREQEISYEELLVDLMMAERGHFAGEDEDTGEILWKSYEGQEEDINRIKQRLSETPFEESYVPLQSVNLSLPIINQRIQTNKGEKWSLICRDGGLSLSKTRNQILQTEEMVLAGDAFPGEQPHALEHIVVSEETAVQISNNFMEKIGRTEMKVADIKRARLIDDMTNEVLGEGYLIYAVSASEGCIPVCYGSYSGCGILNFTNDHYKESYSAPWLQERIVLFVTENGIQDIEWTWPKEIVMTANKNVHLLSFSEVKNNIRKLLKYGLRPDARESLYVERIVLSTAIQQVQDQGNEAFLVPVWIVFVRSESEVQRGSSPGVFMVNALDGTYVGRFG